MTLNLSMVELFKVRTAIFALGFACFALLGCDRFRDGGQVDLFEGDSAVSAVSKIKEKVGSDVRVIRGEIRGNEMRIIVQSPANSQDLDEYVFANGTVQGPNPVQAQSRGDLEIKAEGYPTTSIDDIDFAIIPNLNRLAVGLSKLEGAQVALITLEHVDSRTTDPTLRAQKEQELESLKADVRRRKRECREQKCLDELKPLEERLEQLKSPRRSGTTEWDLAMNVYVESPRGRRAFVADKKGNIIENPYR